MVTDHLGRQFKKLRVSLTSQCNFSCLYCTGVTHESKPLPVPGVQIKPTQAISDQIIANLGKIHAEAELTSVRLTGGEPLLYPGIIEIIGGIKKLGISDISLTTNGFLLPQFVQSLREAGLTSVNVSLDAINSDVFRAMTRRGGLPQVIKGIRQAQLARLDVKLNCVVMRNRNEGEILPLLNFAGQEGIIIRYLELMKMGPLNHTAYHWLVTSEEILQTIGRAKRMIAIPRKDGSTANYWQTSEGQVFGIIANESAPFCSDCNRLRLDSSGNIYGCISNDQGIALQPNDSREAIHYALQRAIAQKQEVRFSGSLSSMMSIGG